MGRQGRKGKEAARKGREKRWLILTTAREDCITIISTMHSPVFLLRTDFQPNDRCHIWEGIQHLLSQDQ